MAEHGISVNCLVSADHCVKCSEDMVVDDIGECRLAVGDAVDHIIG